MRKLDFDLVDISLNSDEFIRSLVRFLQGNVEEFSRLEDIAVLLCSNIEEIYLRYSQLKLADKSEIDTRKLVTNLLKILLLKSCCELVASISSKEEVLGWADSKLKNKENGLNPNYRALLNIFSNLDIVMLDE